MDAKIEATEAVYEATSSRLKSQGALDLWHSLKSELSRQGGGPEAAALYLEAEVARLSGMIERTIASVSGKK